MPSYGKDLEVQHRTRHPMTIDDNPFCPDCRLRTYPQWGPHDCMARGDPDHVTKVRHAAGSILSNLHFYRLPALDQIEALGEAFAFTFGLNVHHKVIPHEWDRFIEKMRAATDRQANLTKDNIVTRTTAKRITVKKERHARPHPTSKADRPHRQTVQARRAHGLRRPKR